MWQIITRDVSCAVKMYIADYGVPNLWTPCTYASPDTHTYRYKYILTGGDGSGADRVYPQLGSNTKTVIVSFANSSQSN